MTEWMVISNTAEVEVGRCVLRVDVISWWIPFGVGQRLSYTSPAFTCSACLARSLSPPKIVRTQPLTSRDLPLLQCTVQSVPGTNHGQGKNRLQRHVCQALMRCINSSLFQEHGRPPSFGRLPAI
ncbi:hypothetical protein SCLCIDRAFT_1215278 [Scleroderma citrinum Foug A]|uniref:Uncharacterized protein n=1 Tax=Scleroderma citrinum Foug A TaxID=1036808 RepID=A0A0C3E139_9AGAM|nr:hypothetical protein SCLCIDRAFT_1215278 [Scleroderma citrinum Foug A]